MKKLFILTSMTFLLFCTTCKNVKTEQQNTQKITNFPTMEIDYCRYLAEKDSLK